MAMVLTAMTAVFTEVSASAAQPSSAGPANSLPSAKPSAITPNVDNGRVFAIAQSGNTMVIGGSFTSVAGVAHQRVAAFDKTTGALANGFAPTVDGDVNAVIPGPTANTVYIGGAFTHVNGVAAQFLALVNLSNGSTVTSFKPPAFNYGYVNDLVLRGSKLYVAGTFTTAGGKQHQGLIAANPTSGLLDPSMNIQLTGHHNDTGSGAQAWVGATDFDVTADGKTMVVIGNFKYVNGQLRDQVALIDLSSTTSALNSWSTTRYSPYCSNFAFDQYVRGVAFSPDGKFFAINATGGPHAGTLCDATVRFETTNVADSQPTWVDESGGDTVWGITVTSTAVFVGGHTRWMNDPYGADNARAGAVPRPGMAALDVQTGRPFAWNPGHIPLGVSVFAYYANSDGVWMGYDENYIGNHAYKRQKIVFFPWKGGYTPASTAVNALPGTVYLGGQQAGGTDGLSAVQFDGQHASAQTAGNQSIDFGNWRGAFVVGKTVYYGYTDSFLYSRTFDGTTFGPAVKVDPYNDPIWSNVVPYSGSPSLRGVVPNWYAQLPNVTGMTYYQGRVYYTLFGDSHLYSKWFLPDSGVIDETTATQSSTVDMSSADGMFVSDSKLYYASSTDGDLRSVDFSGGNVTGTPTVVSGPAVDGVNWKSRALFLGAGAPVNAAPTASFTSQCTSWNCSFNGSGSSDSDGSVASYAWDFGDGSTATAAAPTHQYTRDGTYTVTLTVKDNGGKSSAPVTQTVTVSNAAPTAAFSSGCSGTTCTFDASASKDSDGNVASYAWNFGDGTQGTGVSPTHVYAGAGDYPVSLTVTDDVGATSAPASHVVSTTTQATVKFVGAANAGGGNVKVKTLQIPAAASVGDTAVLSFAQNATVTWTGPTGVTGWTQVDSYTNGSLLTTIWVKRLAAGDPGASVHFDTAALTHASEDVAVYSGVDATNPVTAFAHSGDISGTTHTTPTASAGAGDYVVSLWASRAASTVTWTASSGQLTRDRSADSGSLTLQALVTDAGAPSSAGTVGSVPASTDVSTRASMETLVLNAA